MKKKNKGLKKSDPVEKTPAQELRRQAEKLILRKSLLPPVQLDSLSAEEARYLVHELQVHQIELEMQNEELRRAEAEIEASRERYFDLYDLAPVGYVTISEKGLILEANLTIATMLRVTRDALVKQPLTRFIHRGDQDIYYLYLKRLFETGAFQESEIRMLQRGGSYIWVRLEATAAHDVDGYPVCHAIVSDVTGRKRAEEELHAAVQEKEDLLGELQHRIKNSFAMIKSILSLMKSKIVSLESLEFLNDLHSRINALIEIYDLLYKTNSVRNVSLDDYLSRLVSSLPFQSEKITIRKELDAITTPVSKAIPLGFISVELITNAVKYAFPEKKGIISISLKKTGTGATLHLYDNGVGLPENFDVSTVDSLGLKLVKAFVSQIGGSLEIKSDQGVQYKIDFPLKADGLK